MKILRKLLFPFAVLYVLITSIRNFLFDKGILKSYSFDLPIIAVGNLSVGGTGKTPQIEYLIRLLSQEYKVATLSRGYKRQSKGFVLANETADATLIGDEPFQYFLKFPTIQVAVDADRKNGIEQLLIQPKSPEVLLLDDAFQHRKVKAGLYILLTTYDDLYADDYILPVGNLRESRSGSIRAQVVIVTKCPKNLSLEDQNKIKLKLHLAENQQLFFSYIQYDDCVYSENKTIRVADLANVDKLLLAGIAKPKSFFAYLQSEKDVVLTYPDHNHFSENEIQEIINKAKNNIIITTEKDYVRLKGSISSAQLYYLPIKSELLLDETIFNKTILNYVGTSTRNR